MPEVPDHPEDAGPRRGAGAPGTAVPPSPSLATLTLPTADEELRALVGALADVVLVLDHEGRYLKVAPTARAALARPPEELVGRTLDEVFPPHEARALMSFVRRALAASGPVDGEYSMTIDGRELWFSVTVTRLTPLSVLWIARDVTARRRAEEALRHAAFHDPLTGLPNRASLMAHLDVLLDAAPSRARPAVLFMDFDRFKIVNDSLGHAAGDLLLRAVAGRLAEAVAGDGLLGRFGGDEFAVVVESAPDAARLEALAHRITGALARPFVVHGREVFAGASVGIAVADESHETADELVRDADLAMYDAKLGGRARVARYTPALRTRADQRLTLEAELRRALAGDELRVHYQPICSMGTGACTGFEALVRWQHPARGLLAPGEFLPVAEDAGLMTELGEWVLRNACAQLAEWRARHGRRHPSLSVSVNLAAAQLVQPDLVPTVRDALAAAALPPDALRLEVTENILARDAEMAETVLHELDGLGVRLLMDDFGTGHSSLGYLHRFPMSTVKIDRFFVGRLDEQRECVEIVRAIVALAHALEMDVVAEGVERPEQRELLGAMGCEYLQGYLIAPPLPPQEAARHLGA